METSEINVVLNTIILFVIFVALMYIFWKTRKFIDLIERASILVKKKYALSDSVSRKPSFSVD